MRPVTHRRNLFRDRKWRHPTTTTRRARTFGTADLKNREKMNHKKKKKKKQKTIGGYLWRSSCLTFFPTAARVTPPEALLWYFSIFPVPENKWKFLFLFRFGLIERAGGMRIVVISSVAKRKKGGTHKTVKCDKSQKKRVAPIRLAPWTIHDARVCPSVCVKTDTQRNKKKKDNHRSPCPTVKTRKGTKILTETRREEVPPLCGLLSVTQEEFFQFDFFFRPRLLLAAAHSIRWGLLLLPCVLL